MVTFWNWFVRNPAFLAGGLAFAAGSLDILEWAIALPVGTAGMVVGDAAWHLARKTQLRRARADAAFAAESSSEAALRRFTDYNRVEREKIA